MERRMAVGLPLLLFLENIWWKGREFLISVDFIDFVDFKISHTHRVCYLSFSSFCQNVLIFAKMYWHTHIQIFVIGDEYYTELRPSIRNLGADSKQTVFFDSHEVSKPKSASHLNEVRMMIIWNRRRRRRRRDGRRRRKRQKKEQNNKKNKKRTLGV